MLKLAGVRKIAANKEEVELANAQRKVERAKAAAKRAVVVLL